MKRCMVHLACVLLFLGIAGCERDTPPGMLAPTEELASLQQPANDGASADARSIAAELIAAAGWELVDDAGISGVTALAGDKSRHYHMNGFDREVLVGDIVHYSILLEVGPEPFGVIGLHRVVRESQPNRPIRARESLFMVHGAGVGFVDAFMPSTRLDYMPSNNSLPIFLAQNGVDVWGIDMAWTFIPNETTDFSFAADWGLQREVDDLRAGIEIARSVRLLTGNGWRKMNMLGWSTGAEVGYAYLNEESQLPRGHRHVQGFVAVDATIKSDDETLVASSCATYLDIQAARESGVYVDDTGTLAQALAYLAASDPDGESPIVPGYTNLQFILAAETQTAQLFGGYPPQFHLLAGVFDANQVPIGLQHLDTQFAVDFYAAWTPYQPNGIELEVNGLRCDEVDLPYDDHLADIEVPILYVAPGGGNGTLGAYMEYVLGSDDFQSLIVSNTSDPYLDLGHVDLFVAYLGVDLVSLMWQPILDWMQDHRPSSEDSSPIMASTD